MPLETPPSVVSAIEHCLKPIARLCIHFRVDYRILSEMLKAAFVSVAEDEFKVNGEPRTNSRIALMTGVHRRDIRRLLGKMPYQTTPKQHGLVANLIAHWQGMPELWTNNGEAKPIPRNPNPKYPVSFAALAKALTNDIHPRALLDECISRGLVSLTDDDMVLLTAESLVKPDDLDGKTHFICTNH